MLHYDRPTNTRLVITPSGDTHIGHAWIALLNKTLAEATGGTFHLRHEVGLATADEAMRLGAQVVADNNTADLEAFGLGPHGAAETDLEYGVAAEVLWHQTGARTAFGLWGLRIADPAWAQAVSIANLITDDEMHAVLDPAVFYRLYQKGIYPSWTAWTRAAIDIICGINCHIRGNDLAIESRAYAMMAAMICNSWPTRQPPQQLFAPRLWATYPDGPADAWVPISSSNPRLSNGFYLKDLRAAGKDATWLQEELWRRFLPPGIPPGVDAFKGGALANTIGALVGQGDIRMDRAEWLKAAGIR